jgi:hypothetical protein
MLSPRNKKTLLAGTINTGRFFVNIVKIKHMLENFLGIVEVAHIRRLVFADGLPIFKWIDTISF